MADGVNFEAVQLHLVQTWEEAESFLQWLAKPRNILGVDTETGGVEWWHNSLRLVQVGDTSDGWAIPWQEWGGLVKEAFRRYTGQVVMHNAKFDERFLRRNGVAIPRRKIHDTQTLVKLLDSSGLKGLKPAASRYLDNRLSALQDDLRTAFSRHSWTWETVPVDYPDYWRYGALDPVLSVGLWEKLSKSVLNEFKTAYELDCAATWVTSDMEERGARIDVTYCERKLEELTEYVEAMSLYIRQNWNCGTSDREVSGRLIRDGVELEKRTLSGQLSVDKEVLESVTHPLAEAVLSRRQAQKMASAYFRNLVNFRDGEVVHPDVDLLGTNTGRMSISRPALQQVPSDRSPAGTAVREAFIAREGHKLVDVDYDQEEQRLVASFSTDPGMIAAFEEADKGGVDFFTTMARMIFNDPTLAKSDIRRQRTKNASYARAYGAGPATVAVTVKITEEEAAELFRRQDETFPRLAAWQREMQNEAVLNGQAEGRPFITTPWGRRLYIDPDALYTAVNYLCQGTAADVLKQKMVELDSAGMAGYLVLPVHDEVLFDVPEEEADEFSQEVVGVLQEQTRFRVPLNCGANQGNNWSQVH